MNKEMREECVLMMYRVIDCVIREQRELIYGCILARDRALSIEDLREELLFVMLNVYGKFGEEMFEAKRIGYTKQSVCNKLISMCREVNAKKKPEIESLSAFSETNSDEDNNRALDEYRKELMAFEEHQILFRIGMEEMQRQLTERELRLFWAWARGMPQKEIAKLFKKKQSNVSVEMKKLRRKILEIISEKD